jgi:GDP-4-dehydro-6-deoxy-D-mannose reductase
MDQAPDSLFSGSTRNYHYHAADIMNREQVAGMIRAVAPDVVFHLAAQSYPGVSWEQPGLTFHVNVLGTANIMEAIREAGLKSKILVVCSSAEYAPEAGSIPIREDVPLRPSSPYGISKLAQDHMARLYFEHYGMPTVRLRPFFLIGPRKRGDVCSDWARGVVAIERGLNDSLPVGNLDVVRDLLDVRDGIEAFQLLAEKGRPGDVYNICSGQGTSLRQVLDILKSLAGTPVRERTHESLLRPLDEMIRIGDPGKLLALGWRPKRSIKDTLKDILEYWRQAES